MSDLGVHDADRGVHDPDLSDHDETIEVIMMGRDAHATTQIASLGT